jgi:hypothetical protein
MKIMEPTKLHRKSGCGHPAIGAGIGPQSAYKERFATDQTAACREMGSFSGSIQGSINLRESEAKGAETA